MSPFWPKKCCNVLWKYWRRKNYMLMRWKIYSVHTRNVKMTERDNKHCCPYFSSLPFLCCWSFASVRNAQHEYFCIHGNTLIDFIIFEIVLHSCNFLLVSRQTRLIRCSPSRNEIGWVVRSGIRFFIWVLSIRSIRPSFIVSWFYCSESCCLSEMGI